jgi:ubiquinone/menaquinone biosynthesis C-methylase UbiE
MPSDSQSHADGRGHTWQSKQYVAEWIAKDAGRPAREQSLDSMLAAAPFAGDAEIAVLDVGAGNGRVTEAVLRAFPRAKVTLQDFSQPMLDEARARFASRRGQLRYVLGDLTDPAWIDGVGGLFDLAVSGIAIHNLAELAVVTTVYQAVCGVLKPGGCFLDADHFENCGGLAANMEALRKIGFARVELVGQEGHPSIVKANV